MDAVPASLAVLALMFVLLGTGLWIFVALLLTSLLSLLFIADFSLGRVGAIIQPVFVQSVTSWELAAIPLFLWMGEIVNRSDISERLFRGLTPWVARLPGGLLHTNVGGCVLFAAVSGSSVATAATIGKVTTRALEQRHYDTHLSIGSVAAAGSIGIMIPPSLTMIIYGLISEVSVARLFAAGLIPGLLLGALYSGYIAARALANPGVAPVAEKKPSLADLMRGLFDMALVGFLIALVLGGIYSGLATPSEAAALGVAGALLVAAFSADFGLADVLAAAMGAVRTSAMVGSAFAAALLLSTTMGYLHMPQTVATWIAGLELSPVELIIVLGIFYIVLGCVLESITLILMTMPISFPLVVQAGFDPVWFGVFLVLVVEMGLVTPPIGFNLFVIRGVTGHSIGRIARGAFPFFLLMLLATVLITAFPEIALWLPQTLFDR